VIFPLLENGTVIPAKECHAGLDPVPGPICSFFDKNKMDPGYSLRKFRDDGAVLQPTFWAKKCPDKPGIS